MGSSPDDPYTGKQVEISFSLPHVFFPGSSSQEDSGALEELLEALIRINMRYIVDNHPVPLYQSGVVYGRTTVWDSIPALYAKGFGDCKSLTAALVAEYRCAGKKAKANFRWKERAGGGKDFHILVLTPNGYEDPSRVLGMGRNENEYFRR